MLTCLVSQTRMTGIPAMMELGSSSAAEFTVSLAPITSVKSKSSISGFTSSISCTMSYGTPASARSTFSWPGIRPSITYRQNQICSGMFLLIRNLRSWTMSTKKVASSTGTRQQLLLVATHWIRRAKGSHTAMWAPTS